MEICFLNNVNKEYYIYNDVMVLILNEMKCHAIYITVFIGENERSIAVAIDTISSDMRHGIFCELKSRKKLCEEQN